MTYHSRWDDLTTDDYDELFGKSFTDHTRGQRVDYRMALDTLDVESIPLPHTGITDKIDFSKRRIAEFVNAYSLRMMSNMVQYCKDNGIEVMLCKTPKVAWSDLRHDATNYFAKQLDVPFLDFNLPALEKEIELDHARDFYDNTHLNVYGSKKLTTYLSTFIAKHYSIPDISDDTRYEFMKADSEEYAKMMAESALGECQNLSDYIDLLDNDRLTIFLAINGDVSPLSGSAEGKKLAKLGFETLADTRDPNRAYAGIVHAGKLVMEKIRNAGDPILARIEGQYKDGKITALMQLRNQPDAMPRTRFVTMGVCGSNTENQAVIWIDDEDLSENGLGVNFVVIDRITQLVVDTSCFDFHQKGSPRTSNQVPEEYLERLKTAK